MLVAFVVMVVVMMLVTGSSFGRIGLLVAFEGFSRTQRFAFQAQRAPIELRVCRIPDRKITASASEPFFFYF